MMIHGFEQLEMLKLLNISREASPSLPTPVSLSVSVFVFIVRYLETVKTFAFLIVNEHKFIINSWVKLWALLACNN